DMEESREDESSPEVQSCSPVQVEPRAVRDCLAGEREMERGERGRERQRQSVDRHSMCRQPETIKPSGFSGAAVPNPSVVLIQRLSAKFASASIPRPFPERDRERDRDMPAKVMERERERDRERGMGRPAKRALSTDDQLRDLEERLSQASQHLARDAEAGLTLSQGLFSDNPLG
ncbi:hypothetical protein KIPB_011577, partial [Kipferlia bialata]